MEVAGVGGDGNGQVLSWLKWKVKPRPMLLDKRRSALLNETGKIWASEAFSFRTWGELSAQRRSLSQCFLNHFLFDLNWGCLLLMLSVSESHHKGQGDADAQNSGWSIGVYSVGSSCCTIPFTQRFHFLVLLPPDLGHRLLIEWSLWCCNCSEQFKTFRK